jgi:predicted metalloprotease
METGGHRRSGNFEDRGSRRAAAGGGIPVAALAGLVRMLGVKGTLIVGAIVVVAYFLMPGAFREQVGGLTGESGPAGSGASVCEASQGNAEACDFSRVVLASTEDVWTQMFGREALPSYNRAAGAYQHPTLVVFSGGVSTGGCGNASSAVGPFYCPADQNLYIDPGFYQVMEQRLRAPGDFAQAYVIAHEVGHHVQNLIGSNQLQVRGENSNQTSVRVELQADCFAGVWGHSARASLQITDEDLDEALAAAHAIGDDSLGQADSRSFTHGSSEQRKRWFKRGFDSGNPQSCDTFSVQDYRGL